MSLEVDSIGLETFSPDVYEILNQNLTKTLSGSYMKKTDLITILHMSRQLSCRDMCKIVNRLDH